MLKANILLLLLHLGVGPFSHGHVDDLVLDGVHNGDWHTINVAQVDRGRENAPGEPLLQTYRLLELTCDSNL